MRITRRQLRHMIVEALAKHYMPGMPMLHKRDMGGVSYTALELDDASRESLLHHVPPGWTAFANHMTLIGPMVQKQGRLPERFLGQQVCVKVVGIVSDDRVVAGVVDLGDVPLLMRGPSFPHITIATNIFLGGKPHMSNELSPHEMTPIQPVTVCGVIQEIAHKLS